MSKKLNISDKVYDFLIEKIKIKEWKSNTKIMSENQICDELNVSRVAVRSAIDRLIALGLLKRKKGIGTFVTDINASSYMTGLMPMLLLENKDILSILEFRVYFEYSNIVLFMQHKDDQDIKELENLFEVMKRSIDVPEEFYLADFEFHNVIANGTKNPIVIKINEVLIELLKSHQKALYNKIGPNIGLEYHESILKSIKANDTELAALYMKRHIEVTIENYKNNN